MKSGVFISGTDTGVGKTITSSLLISSLKSFGIRAGYFKPIQTGSELDTETVRILSRLSFSELVLPTYSFLAPVAPSRAALIEGKEIQLDQVVAQWEKLDDRTWVLEGAGGLLVPLNSKQTIRDLIVILNLKLLIVSSTRLGTINHTLLTVEAAQAAGISIVGIVLVGEEDPGLEDLLKERSGMSILTKIPVLNPLTPDRIQESAPQYFSAFQLKACYGESLL